MTSLARILFVGLFALASLTPTAAAQFGPPAQVNEVAVFGGLIEPADIDGDGHVDLVNGERFGRIVWSAGLGGGQQGPARLVDVHDQITDLALADLDGDGDLDLVAVASLGNGDFGVYRYEFLGAEGFGPRVTIDGSLDGIRTDLGDFNGDGDVDVLCYDNDTREVFYFENLGGGQISSVRRVIVTGEDTLLTVEAGDLDGDGDVDVVAGVAVGWSYAFAVYENVGGGVFVRDAVLTIFWGHYREFSLGDLDGDGDLDILGAPSDDRFDWYEQTSPMTFVNRFQFLQTQNPGSCDIGDVDGDGDLDLVTYAGDLEWHENVGTIAFVTHPLGPTPYSFGRVRCADFDGTGTLDIVWSAAGTILDAGWLPNAGGGAFGPSESLVVTEGPLPGAVAAADFDLDGDIDLAMASKISGAVGMWEQTPSGDFGAFRPIAGIFPQGVRRSECLARDVDGDGDPDLLFAINVGAWMENLGTNPATFGPLESLFGGTLRVNSMRVEDLDGDGWLDVLMTNDNQGQVWARRGVAAGSFSLTVTIVIDFFSGIGTDLATGDFDGDGDLDVAITDGIMGGIRYAETLPGFDFAPPVTILTGLADAHSIAAVDVDQDGALDLIACGSTRARWLPGAGDGTFLPSEPITGLAIQGNRVKMVVADVDGDGRQDVIISAGGDGSAPSNVAWARNAGQGTWAAGGAFFEASTEIEDLVAVDLDGDLDLELVTVAPLDERVMVHPNEGGVGASYCSPAEVHSGGGRAAIFATGSNRIADDDLTLHAFDLPTNSAGYFLASRVQGFVAQPAGSAGNLCLGGAIGRYVQQVGNSGTSGTLDVSVRPMAIEQPTGPEAAVVGETWSFQCWFRDFVGGTTTSNFTSGYAVRFQ